MSGAQGLRIGIDGLSAGAAPLAGLAAGIVGLMAARYVAIFYGRRAVRKLGVEAHRVAEVRYGGGLGWVANERGPRPCASAAPVLCSRSDGGRSGSMATGGC